MCACIFDKLHLHVYTAHCSYGSQASHWVLACCGCLWACLLLSGILQCKAILVKTAWNMDTPHKVSWLPKVMLRLVTCCRKHELEENMLMNLQKKTWTHGLTLK